MCAFFRPATLGWGSSSGMATSTGPALGPWSLVLGDILCALSLGEIKYATAFTLLVLRFGLVLRNVKQTSQPSTLWANSTNYTNQKQEKFRKIG